MGQSSTVFGSYDQAELDRQLNLRARWPEYEEYFARWTEQSQAARDRLACSLDIAYGESPLETLDLFPAAAAKAPLVVFIHGGYWQSRDKSEFCFLAPAFVESGITFASLNYTLAPQATVEQMVNQVRRAVAWLFRHAEEHRFDRRRIVVCGHSAGGHLAVMAALTDWQAEAADLPADLLLGAASISGLYELEPVRLSYHNAGLRLDADMARRLSPRLSIPSQAPPLLCTVGGGETSEFLRQQEEFTAAWRAAGLAVTVVDMPGHSHFSILDAVADRQNELFAALAATLSERQPESA